MSSKLHEPVSAATLPERAEKRPLKLTQKKSRRNRKPRLTKAEKELRLMTPRMRDLAEGRLKIEDLDWEELTRGQLRDKNGRFSGAAPAMLPRDWHDALAKEILRGAEAEFRKNFDMTMEVLMQMIRDPRTASRERLAALQYVQERVIGKIAEKSEVKSEVTIFDSAITNGEFLVDLGEEQGEIEQ